MDVVKVLDLHLLYLQIEGASFSRDFKHKKRFHLKHILEKASKTWTEIIVKNIINKPQQYVVVIDPLRRNNN